MSITETLYKGMILELIQYVKGTMQLQLSSGSQTASKMISLKR